MFDRHGSLFMCGRIAVRRVRYQYAGKSAIHSRRWENPCLESDRLRNCWTWDAQIKTLSNIPSWDSSKCALSEKHTGRSWDVTYVAVLTLMSWTYARGFSLGSNRLFASHSHVHFLPQNPINGLKIPRCLTKRLFGGLINFGQRRRKSQRYCFIRNRPTIPKL